MKVIERSNSVMELLAKIGQARMRLISKGSAWSAIHRARRFFQRHGIKIHRVVTPKNGEHVDSTGAERIAAAIFRKLVKLSTSELSLSVDAKKRYVKNQSDQIFLSLENYEIVVMTSDYNRSIRLSQKINNKLCDEFDAELATRELAMEKSLAESVKRSLTTILLKIDE